MICPRCGKVVPPDTEICDCGFRFVVEKDADLPAWFDEVRGLLTRAYTLAAHPWQASGKSGSYEDWVRLRIPVSAAVQRSGSFLDIGCSSGFLLQSLLGWVRTKGLNIEPYGLDYSPETLTMARQRLPSYAKHLYLGNAWYWYPSQQFDFVRAELEYVPVNKRQDFITRLLAEFVAPGGRLLLCHYRSRRENLASGWVDEYLCELNYDVLTVESGYSKDGLEQTRVAVIEKG
jgi:SAM-dependent methyltransferase